MGLPEGVTGGTIASYNAAGRSCVLMHLLFAEVLGRYRFPALEPVPAADREHPVPVVDHRPGRQVRLVHDLPHHHHVHLTAAQP